MKVWTASQTLSTYGILSAMNSIRKSATRDTQHDRMGQDLERLGEVDDAEPLEQPGGGDGGVEVESRRERSAERVAEGLERGHARKADYFQPVDRYPAHGGRHVDIQVSGRLVVARREIAPTPPDHALRLEAGEKLVQRDPHADLSRQAQRHLAQRHPHGHRGARGPRPTEVQRDPSHAALERDPVAAAVAETEDRELRRAGAERRGPAARRVGLREAHGRAARAGLELEVGQPESAQLDIAVHGAERDGERQVVLRGEGRRTAVWRSWPVEQDAEPALAGGLQSERDPARAAS